MTTKDNNNVIESIKFHSALGKDDNILSKYVKLDKCIRSPYLANYLKTNR